MRNKRTIAIIATSSEINREKFFEPIGPNGEMLIEYTIFDAIEAGFEKAVIVICNTAKGFVKDEIQQKFRKLIQLCWVVLDPKHQPKFLNAIPAKLCEYSSYALWKSRKYLNGSFLLVNGESYNGKQLYQEALKIMKNEGKELTVLNYKLGATLSEFGSVDRSVCITDSNSNKLNHIVELKQIRKRAGAIEHNYSNLIELSEDTYATTGIYCLNTSFFEAFESILALNKRAIWASKKKITIADIINHALKKEICETKMMPVSSDWFSIKYKPERILAISKIRALVDRNKYPERLNYTREKRRLKFQFSI